jgi:hypothetical protein
MLPNIYFSNRILDIWNGLPASVVTSHTIAFIKQRLRRLIFVHICGILVSILFQVKLFYNYLSVVLKAQNMSTN